MSMEWLEEEEHDLAIHLLTCYARLYHIDRSPWQIAMFANVENGNSLKCEGMGSLRKSQVREKGCSEVSDWHLNASKEPFLQV